MLGFLRQLFSTGDFRRKLIKTVLLHKLVFICSWLTVYYASHAKHWKEERQLLQIHVLFRHGHRSPHSVYRTDPNPASLWTEGLGALTQLGKMQNYAFGSFLRKRYENFITPNFREVDCISSKDERCLNAAYSLLASFSPPSPNSSISDDIVKQSTPVECLSLENGCSLNGSSFSDSYKASSSNSSSAGNIRWKPIAVKFIAQVPDKYFMAALCPSLAPEFQKMAHSSEAREFLKKYRDLYYFWSNNSGEIIYNFLEAGHIFKSIQLQNSLNLTVPGWAQQTWNDLSIQSDMCYYLKLKSPMIHRLLAGPLLGRIINLMNHRIQHPDDPVKLYLYSGHGTNIAVMLQALNVFDRMAPPYSAGIIFELYRESCQHTFRVLYSNSQEPENKISPPKVLIVPGCTEYCPLDYFEKFTERLIPADWEKECYFVETK